MLCFVQCVRKAWTDGLDYFLIQGLSWTEVWMCLHIFWTIRNLLSLQVNEAMNKFWMLLVPASLISVIYQCSYLALSNPLFSLGRSYLSHTAWHCMKLVVVTSPCNAQMRHRQQKVWLSQERRCQKCDVLEITGQEKEKQYLKEWWEEWLCCEHVYGIAHM